MLSSLFCLIQGFVFAQTNAGSISGSVTDPDGRGGARGNGRRSRTRSAVIRGSRASDSSGNYQFTNVPFNPYHLTVTATGFASFVEDVDLRSSRTGRK